MEEGPNIATRREPMNRKERRHGVGGSAGTLKERALEKKLSRKAKLKANPRLKLFKS